jgi:hypothetical protein
MPGGRQLALNSRKTTILIIRRRRKPGYRPNRDSQNCGTVCGSPPIRPYSELRLVLPSKTPAKGDNGFVSPMLRLLRKNSSKA